MLRAITDVLTNIHHIVKVAYRYATGRWYIFRDLPDSFVEACAKDLTEKQKKKPIIVDIQRTAFEELSLRARKSTTKEHK